MNGSRRFMVIRGALFQFVLVGLAAVFYFLVRGLTQGNVGAAVTHARSILRLERDLQLDVEAGLQHVVLRRRPLTTVANWVYMWGHWPVIVPALVALYVRDRKHYVVLRNAMFLSGAVGLFIFALWPVAPPRLMPPGSGYVDTVTVWSNSYRILQPPALVNKYAAMPSFHVGWNLLVGVMVWKTFRRPWARVLAVASPILMATAVVATANHFVLDFVVGCAIALAALTVSYRFYGYTSQRGIDLAHLQLLGPNDSPAHRDPKFTQPVQVEAS
ncbi:MAG: phosphatase PAP2 family protein [Acidimicrobiales bacterium]